MIVFGQFRVFVRLGAVSGNRMLDRVFGEPKQQISFGGRTFRHSTEERLPTHVGILLYLYLNTILTCLGWAALQAFHKACSLPHSVRVCVALDHRVELCG